MVEKLASFLIISDEKKAKRGLLILILLPLFYISFVILRDFRGMSSAWAFNIGVNLMSSLVCVAAYRSCMRDSARIGEHKKDLFLTLLFFCGTSVFLAGTAWIMNGIESLIFLNRLCNVLLFSSDFILVLIFWACEKYILNVDEKICKYVNTYIEIILIPALLCILANLFLPFYFIVDADGFYRRENFFILNIIWYLPIQIGIIAGIFNSRSSAMDKLTMASFVIIPPMFLTITIFKFHTSFLEPSMFYAVFMIYHLLVDERARKLVVTQTEINIAANLQESVLPHVFPPFPEHTEFDLYASMTPAREVGGDYYDFLMIDDDHLAVLIADVSDKGVSAALFMMATKNLINYRIRQGGTPAEILTDINAHVARDNDSDMFVTVWLGILDLKSGVLTCTNAGHENPAVCGANGVFQIFKDKHGMVLGVMPNIKYRDYQMKMEPGSKIFVYTDGVPDATNSKGERYGTDQLVSALNKTSGETPEIILRNIHNDIDNFVGNAKQFDDLTMLCLEYKGQSSAD